MKRFFVFALSLAAVLAAFSSCGEKIDSGGSGSSYVFTDGSDNITSTSARLHAHYNGTKIEGGNVGIICDKEGKLDATKSPRESSVTGEDGKFYVTFFDLTPNTVYEYMAYAMVEGKEYYGKKKSFKTPTISVTGISISPSSAKLIFGQNETIQLTPVFTPSNALNQNVTWKSSKPEVASVSNTGFVKALTEGKTTITVKTEDGGKEASCEVTCEKISVTDITITPERSMIQMIKGKTLQLTANIEPSNAPNKQVEWSIINTKVATINQNGLVTAVGSGYTQVSVKSKDNGRTNSNICHIYVIKNENPTPVDLGLSVKWAPYDVGVDQAKWGMYFSWGETVPKMGEYYLQDTYKMTANFTTLTSNLDAAAVNWGGSWRMPTKAEVTELVTSCAWSWDDSQKVYKATRNDKSVIFYPSGYYTYYYVSGEGSSGAYWTSSGVSSEKAWALSLTKSSSNVVTAKVEEGTRYNGRTIRPVCK